jgi:GTP cyclohydrolase III
VEQRFQKWAAIRMQNSDGGLDAKTLIRVLMTKGESPRDSLRAAWVADLTAGSAQSAQRVSEIAQALGVAERPLMKRVQVNSTTPTILQKAFEARNLIAHELDVIDPDAETRKPLESIRKYRGHDEIAAWCVELLDVTQLITNNVARRLAS